MSTLAERLTAAREERKLSRAQLSQATGISRRAIEHYEYGHYEPGAFCLKQLCQSLKVSADWLIGLTVEGETDFDVASRSPDPCLSGGECIPTSLIPGVPRAP
jgi:transcriptional regulator with XRE-family HTH domain